jgi:hypothetical protein
MELGGFSTNMGKPRLISTLFSQRSFLIKKNIWNDLSERELALQRSKEEYKKAEHLAIKAKMTIEDYLKQNCTLTPGQISNFIAIGKGAVNESGSQERETINSIVQLKTGLKLSMSAFNDLVKQITGVNDCQHLSILEREQLVNSLSLRYKAETGKDFECKRLSIKDKFDDKVSTKVKQNPICHTNIYLYAPWVAAGLLIIAIIPGLPYGFYGLLRWVVCLTACYGVYVAKKKAKQRELCIFIPMVVLFNPIVPIILVREIWAPIDFTCAIILLVSRGEFAGKL